MAALADQLAGGALSEEVPVTSWDETGQLLTSMNKMTGYLGEMVRAMEELRGIIHQSVKMAGELQVSAEALYGQSDVLETVVGKFNAGGASPAESRTPADERRSEASPFIAGAAGAVAMQRVRTADAVH